MKIGDRVFVRGYIDEIRKDTVIIRNAGGYFGTIPSEVITGELPPAQPERMRGRWTPHREKSREYIGATLVYVTYDYWFCDTCGYRVEDGQPLYNFCPNCGAKMD